MKTRDGFTLIELLVTMAIVGVLASMCYPGLKKVLQATDRAKCASNLRQMSTIILNAAQDNDNKFPRIENDPTDPMHGKDAGEVMTLPQLVESQGASKDILKCPADIRNAASNTRGKSYFAAMGSSYEWLPFFEDELVSSPTIRAPFGQFTVPLSQVRILLDYAENSVGPHDRGDNRSSMNVLYADGHVRSVGLGTDAED